MFACDLIVATPEATFAATPAKLGVPYNATGLLTFLNAAPLNIAKEMLFTADPLSVERLCSLGIINHVTDAADLEETTYAIARRIASVGWVTVSLRRSATICTARVFSSSGYRLDDFDPTCPSFPTEELSRHAGASH